MPVAIKIMQAVFLLNLVIFFLNIGWVSIAHVILSGIVLLIMLALRIADVVGVQK